MITWPRHLLRTTVAMLMLAGTALAWSSPPSEPLVTDRDSQADASSSTDVLQEQSIYIPYEKLREVFEREGRGVFLPYDQFQALWQAARRGRWPLPTLQRDAEWAK